jgi:hypothetical protein
MENSMTYVLNRYLVMGDLTVGTMFTQPLAGNGRSRRLRFTVSLDEMWTNYPAWTTFRTLPITDHEDNQSASSSTHSRNYKLNALGNFNK